MKENLEHADNGTYDSNDLICPLCGYHHRDMWESRLDADTEELWECARCEKSFVALVSVTISYEGFELITPTPPEVAP